ncbi:MAG TPA: AraC family transcriptional regulator [Polyangia bacterium]|jgi:AraC-like DNA-binding protein|nr:AraC family transcriptional regulator [Polyangia bacterium]
MAAGDEEGGGQADLPVLVPPELPGVRAIRFDNSTRVYSHYNEAYSIATLFQTQSQVLFRGRRHQAAPGLVALMEPDGIFRHVQIPTPESVGKLHIGVSTVEQAARELGATGAPPRFASFFVQSRPLFRALTRLHLCLEEDTTPLERQSRFAECLRLLIEQALVHAPAPAHAGLEHRAVRRARDLLHARFAERITLEELADAAGLSTYHLLRVFARDLGIPPHSYQNHLRLARAREQLAHGVPARDAALEVGFTDQSHLIRHFRSTQGFTPGAYVRGNDTHAGSHPGLADLGAARFIARRVPRAS